MSNVKLFSSIFIACLLGLACAVPLSDIDVAKPAHGQIWSTEEEPTTVDNLKRGTGFIWANADEPTTVEGAGETLQH
ncbi:hypothetical protein C8J57DRAFT_1383887 [Mycena rebaudengoi]|nr:hypothetical protein C8J57DRAFT_1383887 [Mycena rebaudengoi]